jgi:hypothetical protein
MIVIQVIVTIILSGGIAFFLNKVLANKVEKKHQKLALQVITYSVCFLLAATFLVTVSLRTILDNFIDKKIEFVENELGTTFPNTNILETNIDTTELAATFKELHQILEPDDTAESNYIEKIVFAVFLRKLTNYIYIAENQVTKLTGIADNNGMITIKSIILSLKKQTLDAVSPYFTLAQVAIVILLFVYIGIYIGVVVFLTKGGGSYNKSIVFGEAAGNVEKGMDDRPI